jgi:protein TonB
MEIKKTEKADISKHRMVMFLVGMIISLGVVYGTINYKQYEASNSDLEDYTYDEEEVEVEQTVQEEEPPPPPEAPPQLEIVEDDVEVKDDNPEVDDSETNDDDKIKPIIVPTEVEETDEVFEIYQVQQKAEFKGGTKAMYKFISDNLEYPQVALAEGIEGKVTVQFVVGKNGDISKVQILGDRKVGFGCEEAAMAVVKKMAGMWNPALQRDKPVSMRFRLPIRFQTVN